MTRIGDIVPPYIQLRVQIAAIFRPYMDRAIQTGNSPLLAVLEALEHEVLGALPGGDDSRI